MRLDAHCYGDGQLCNLQTLHSGLCQALQRGHVGAAVLVQVHQELVQCHREQGVLLQ